MVETPKDIRGALDEAMNHRDPALVNVVISQGAARKPQQFRWHSRVADPSGNKAAGHHRRRSPVLVLSNSAAVAANLHRCRIPARGTPVDPLPREAETGAINV
jgi:hypothetical protein